MELITLTLFREKAAFVRRDRQAHLVGEIAIKKVQSVFGGKYLFESLARLSERGSKTYEIGCEELIWLE